VSSWLGRALFFFDTSLFSGMPLKEIAVVGQGEKAAIC